jgi:predicted AAA+ superfamily ATPase
MIPRYIEKQILDALKPGVVIGIFGARRVGKTFLMKKIKEELKGKILFVQGDDLSTAEILSSQKTEQLKRLTSGYDYLFIDEAQMIPNIGQSLKLVVDNIPELAVMVSGSSSFDLKNKIGEPLVGRSKYFHLYPISELEWGITEDFITSKANLENRLIFGSYPQVAIALTDEEKKDKLESIKDGYLLRDILELDNIKNSLFILNLLRLIAFQIGKDISYAELAQNLNVNKKTVMRYLELLEKTFVLFSLTGFSKNLRSEYSRTPRYYFWDNGIRNAVISNYNAINTRDDIGALWENYCISERIKTVQYKNLYSNKFFWRTYDQKEIDYLEERGGLIYGYEFKWGNSRVNEPKLFKDTYSNSEYLVVNKDNYLDFLR